MKTHPSWHGQCLSCFDHLFYRDIIVVLLACVAIWIFVFLRSYLKLETDDQINLTVSLVAEQTVWPVSRCLLVVTRAFPLFHYGMKKLHLSSESNSSCLRRRRKRDTCAVPISLRV